MTRTRRTPKQRQAIFTAFGGVCHICAGKIVVGEAWELEHIIPLAQYGEDGGNNLQPAHVKCHRAKTSQDATDTAKARRREQKHIGAKIKSAGFRKAEPQRTASRPLMKRVAR